MASVVLARREPRVTAFDRCRPAISTRRCAPPLWPTRSLSISSRPTANACHSRKARSTASGATRSCTTSTCGERQVSCARVLRPGGLAVFCEPWGENALLEWGAAARLPYLRGQGADPRRETAAAGGPGAAAVVRPSRGWWSRAINCWRWPGGIARHRTAQPGPAMVRRPLAGSGQPALSRCAATWCSPLCRSRGGRPRSGCPDRCESPVSPTLHRLRSQRISRTVFRHASICCMLGSERSPMTCSAPVRESRDSCTTLRRPCSGPTPSRLPGRVRPPCLGCRAAYS